MKKKNIYIILGVLVLAGLAAILVLTKTNSTLSDRSTDFAVDDTASVTRIFMSDKNNNTLTLERTGQDDWIVNGKFKGSRFNVSMLLQTMSDIEVSQPVSRSARNNIIRQMAASSVKVEIYQQVYRIRILGLRWFRHEKLTRVYYVGGATPSNRGSYFLMEGADDPYVVTLPGLRGFVTPRYMPIEKYWRDYTVIKRTMSEITRVVVEIPVVPEESYVVENTRNGFAMLNADGRTPVAGPVDTLAVLNFLNSFRSLNYEVLLNDLDQIRKDSILSLPPMINLTVTDTAGEVIRIRTFRRPAEPGAVDMNGKPLPYDMDRFYALINDDQDLVIAQFFVFDRVLRPKSFFLRKESK